MQDTTFNVASWIADHAATRGDQLAVRDPQRSLTYAALWERVSRCAGFLTASGVERGDRIALVLGNCTPYLEVIFAAAQLGAPVRNRRGALPPTESRTLLPSRDPRWGRWGNAGLLARVLPAGRRPLIRRPPAPSAISALDRL